MATNKPTGKAGKSRAKRSVVDDEDFLNEKPTEEQQARWAKEEEDRLERKNRFEQREKLAHQMVMSALEVLADSIPTLRMQFENWMEQESERRALTIKNLKLENKFLEVQIAFLEQRLAQGKPVVDLNVTQG